jgi:hypothetical protein
LNLADSFEKSKQKLSKHLTAHISSIRYSKKIYENAVRSSVDEIISDVRTLGSNPGTLQLLNLIRDIADTTHWVGNSYAKFLSSFIRPINDSFRYIDTEEHMAIMRFLNSKKSLEDSEFFPHQIFAAIYNEIAYSNANAKYKRALKSKKIEPTVVLISGVFNELFKTAAFERGVEHLKKKRKLNYIITEVHGAKGTKHNAELIKEQLEKYIKKNPKKKLWLLTYSKGGIDALHFLKDNPDFAEKYISGLSTIAAPILGSNHLDHKVLRAMNAFHNISDPCLKKLFKQSKDFVGREIQRSLDSKYQKSWFTRSKKHLPSNLFYTSMAFESQWHECHFWMILAKMFFYSKNPNDGIVDVTHALFPKSFTSHNLGVLKGHHLSGSRSSSFDQEALIEAHIIYLQARGLL